MKFTLFIVSLLSCFGVSFSSRKAAKFVSETVAESSGTNTYKKIRRSSYFGLFGENSKSKCTIVCLHQDTCESVHMDGEACVFGVSDDVTAFEEGEETNPYGNQRILSKSMFLNSYLVGMNY